MCMHDHIIYAREWRICNSHTKPVAHHTICKTIYTTPPSNSMRARPFSFYKAGGNRESELIPNCICKHSVAKWLTRGRANLRPPQRHNRLQWTIPRAKDSLNFCGRKDNAWQLLVSTKRMRPCILRQYSLFLTWTLYI